MKRQAPTKKSSKEVELVKTFPVNDAEIVVANLTNFLHKFVNSKIQANYVYTHDKEFALKHSMAIVEQFINIATIEADTKDHGFEEAYEIFDIKAPKIDPWAANKASTVSVTTSQENSFKIALPKLRQSLPTINKKVLRILEASKKIHGLERRHSALDLNLGPNIFSHRSGDIISTGSSRKGTGKSKHAFVLKTDDNIPVYALYNDRAHDVVDVVDQMNENKWRAEAITKEAERIKRDKLNKEIEEKRIENEKRIKKLTEDIKNQPVSFDDKGNYIEVQPVDVNKLVSPLQGKVILKDPVVKKKLALNKKIRSRTLPIDIEVISEDKVFEQIPQIHFQPDPLKSHQIPIGVTLSSNGLRKKGGDYFKEGCLNYQQYYELLKHHRPHFKDQKLTTEEGKQKAYDIITEEQATQGEIRHTRLIELFTEAYKPSIEVEKEVSVPKPQSNKALQQLFKEKQSEDIISHYIIEKKPTLDRLTKTKAFRYDLIENIRDEINFDLPDEIFDNQEEDRLKSPKNMPSNKHIDVRTELGLLHKYPRERLPKELLEITGRVLKKEKLK
jgi:hypothetical protein